jgi:hypothetical protein
VNYGKTFTLSNSELANNGTGIKASYSRDGIFSITNNTIRDNSSFAINSDSSYAHWSLDNNVISGNGQLINLNWEHGVSLTNNKITNNQGYIRAYYIRDNFIFTDNTVTGGSSYGVYFNSSESSGDWMTNGIIVEDNIIDDNGSNGIYIRSSSSADPAINRNKVRNNSGYGIFVETHENNTQPSIHDNEITGNGNAGLYVSGKAVPSVVGNIIDDNGSGIYVNYDDVNGNGDFALTDNLITNNQGYGLSVNGYAKPVISNNDIYGNMGYALENHTSFALVAKNNWWGAEDSAEINEGTNPKALSFISDGNTNGSAGKVNYAGWLSTSINGSGSIDTDGDGINDDIDTDDDNDGMPDTFEMVHSLNPLDASDAILDSDSDGLSNLKEYNTGTDPALTDSDGDGVPDGEDAYPLDPYKSSDSRIALNIYAPQSVYGTDVGETVTIPVMYQSSDDSQISALSFKLYFNSQLLQWNETTNLISTGLLGGMDAVYDDTDNDDNDALTNSYLQVTWFDLSNNWPGVSGEIKLFDIEFSLLQDLEEETTSLAIVGEDAGISSGYKVVAEPIDIAMSSFSFDVNGDGKVTLPIDGFIILRSMVGFPASALASDEDMADASRTRDEMAELLNNVKESLLLDINGDGKVSLPIDGFIILRYMVGFPASALASDEDMIDATRTRDEMKSYMDSFR